MYLKNIPSSPLNWLLPLEKRKSLINIRHNVKSLVKDNDIHKLHLIKTS